LFIKSSVFIYYSIFNKIKYIYVNNQLQNIKFVAKYLIFSWILFIIYIGNLVIIYAKMKFIKKIWFSLIWLCIMLWLNYSFADGLRIGQPVRITYSGSDPVISWNDVENNSISQWSNLFSNWLRWIIHIPQSDEYPTSLWYVIALIQIAINRLLWILAFVALIYMIYNWFLVFTSGSDDKNASKGKKWIWTAAIALAWIWLSWLIISIILWFINNIAAS
jgi:hypothetical protein